MSGGVAVVCCVAYAAVLIAHLRRLRRYSRAVTRYSRAVDRLDPKLPEAEWRDARNAAHAAEAPLDSLLADLNRMWPAHLVTALLAVASIAAATA